MIKIIPLTKEHIKKFNILGCDVSIGFAAYATTGETPYSNAAGSDYYFRDINYLYDHNEEDGIITHRLILWRFKIEVKSVVQYNYSFA
jgi:hypothetical protein